jgi:hypothetical protein
VASTNIFGLASGDRPLGSHFLHASVVLLDNEFLSTILVESESAVLYKRELRFGTREEAETDLYAQLHFMQDATLEDLRQITADNYDEPFDWREHRTISAQIATQQVTLNQLVGRMEESELLYEYVGLIDMDKPLTVITLSKAQIGNLRAPDGSTIIQAYKTALRSQRKLVEQYSKQNLANEVIVVSGGELVDGYHRAMAAFITGQPLKAVDLDELSVEGASEEGEFDTHEPTSIGDVNPKLHYLSQRTAGVLEHYSRQPNLREIDPKFHGQGIPGAESRRKKNDPATWVDRAYFYEGGSKPEPDLEGTNRYTAQLPPDARIYDIGADPDKIIDRSLNPSGHGVDLSLLEKNVKDAGYFGFKNSKSSMPYAVGVFYSLPVTRGQESEAQSRYMGELILTTIFVKRAGSTENYLQSLGVQPDVIQFVSSQPPDTAKKLVNEVRKNNALTVDQLQQLAQGLASKQKYEPTQRELALANRYEEVPGMSDWVLIQFKKHRVKRRSPVGGTPPTFPQYEFTYNWLKIQQLGYLSPDESAAAIVDELDSIKDWVRATQPQLASFDLLSAKTASDKWHLEQSQQGKGQGYQENNVVHTFKNGWTIQLVRSENDLKVEGNLMGHCVGSYCNYVTMGDSIIYSLRDPQNAPHATIEVKGDIENEPEENDPYPYYSEQRPESHGPVSGQWEIVQIQGKQNQQPIPEYKAMIKEWFTGIGPENISMGQEDTDLYSRLYSAEPQEFADMIDAAANLEEVNDYGVPIPPERWDARTMENLYEQIIEMIQKQYRREHSYIPRQMGPIASALADLAWNADMKEVQGDISKWSIDAGETTPERIMEIFTKARSSMSGIHREMDKHQEEFDRWDFDPGFRVEEFDDEDKFYEAESEARDQAYGEWLSGGFDMAINRRWQERVQQAGGKYPWDILKERLTPKKQTRKKRNAETETAAA